MERATKLVIDLLAKGMPQHEVAEVTGNSPSAISQVATKYSEQIAARQTDMSLGNESHSGKLDKLESLLTDKLLGMVALETDSAKVLTMFRTVNSAARRDAGETPHGTSKSGNQQVVVQLNVPQHMQQPAKIITNTNNDVVAVDGRDLTPASINSVNSLAGISRDTDSQLGDSHGSNRKHKLDELMEAVMPAHTMPEA